MGVRRRVNGTGGGWIRVEKRYAIYARDNLLCVWCGQPAYYHERGPTLDHIYNHGHPLYSHDASAVVTCCWHCNSQRQDAPLLEWLERLAAAGWDTQGALIRMARRHLPLDRAAGRDLYQQVQDSGWSGLF